MNRDQGKYQNLFAVLGSVWLIGQSSPLWATPQCPTDLLEQPSGAAVEGRLSDLQPEIVDHFEDGCKPAVNGTVAIGKPLCMLGDVPMTAISVAVLASEDAPIHALYVFEYEHERQIAADALMASEYLPLQPENTPTELTVLAREHIRTGVYRSGNLYIATSKPDEWASGPLWSDVMYVRDDQLDYVVRDVLQCQ